MKNNNIKPLLLALCLNTPFITAAQTTDDYPMLNLTAGKIGVFDDEPMKANRYGIEYRSTKITKWGITPAFGYSWSTNGTKYIYSDLKKDWSFKNNLVFTLSLGTGLFENNDAIDLGHAIEFRSGFEITYRFKQGYRLGLVAYHLSNSRISSVNPGTETLAVTFLAPLNKLFGK